MDKEHDNRANWRDGSMVIALCRGSVEGEVVYSEMFNHGDQKQPQGSIIARAHACGCQRAGQPVLAPGDARSSASIASRAQQQGCTEQKRGCMGDIVTIPHA